MLSRDPVKIPSEWLESGAPLLEIDFGCHRGTFLVGMATRHPGVNFLGIEKQRHRVARCQAKIVRAGLFNAWTICGEGADVLRESIPDGVVGTFHLSFPDPWPKRRHAGRRVFNPEFFYEIWRILRPGGVLRLMTDDAGYFEEMGRTVPAEWLETPWDDGRESVRTTFEMRFRAMGHEPFCRAVARPAINPPERDPEPRRDEDVARPASEWQGLPATEAPEGTQ